MLFKISSARQDDEIFPTQFVWGFQGKICGLFKRLAVGCQSHRMGKDFFNRTNICLLSQSYRKYLIAVEAGTPVSSQAEAASVAHNTMQWKTTTNREAKSLLFWWTTMGPYFGKRLWDVRDNFLNVFELCHELQLFNLSSNFCKFEK